MIETKDAVPTSPEVERFDAEDATLCDMIADQQALLARGRELRAMLEHERDAVATRAHLDGDADAGRRLTAIRGELVDVEQDMLERDAAIRGGQERRATIATKRKEAQREAIDAEIERMGARLVETAERIDAVLADLVPVEAEFAATKRRIQDLAAMIGRRTSGAIWSMNIVRERAQWYYHGPQNQRRGASWSTTASKLALLAQGLPVADDAAPLDERVPLRPEDIVLPDDAVFREAEPDDVEQLDRAEEDVS